MNTTAAEPQKVRALFLSDIHLGTRACHPERLLELLKSYDPDYIFLLGDIVDFWAMSRSIYWPTTHSTVVQKILKRARHDVRVFLIPGNHDEVFREYVGSTFGNITIVREWVHTASDGRRYLLLHGDEYDQVTACHKWVSILGDVSYTALVHLNRGLSYLRRKLGVRGHWSLADYAKRNVLRAVSFISNYEQSIVHCAKRLGLDGAICGHIHTPVIKRVDGFTYMNCGDWVDSCTAIVEHYDGRMQLVRETPADQPAALATTKAVEVPVA